MYGREGRLHKLYLNILYINYGTNKKRARYIKMWFTYAVVHLYTTGRWSWSISCTWRQVRSTFRNFKFSKQIVKIKWIFLRNSLNFELFHQRKIILIKNIWNVLTKSYANKKLQQKINFLILIFFFILFYFFIFFMLKLSCFFFSFFFGFGFNNTFFLMI